MCSPPRNVGFYYFYFISLNCGALWVTVLKTSPFVNVRYRLHFKLKCGRERVEEKHLHRSSHLLVQVESAVYISCWHFIWGWSFVLKFSESSDLAERLILPWNWITGPDSLLLPSTSNTIYSVKINYRGPVIQWSWQDYTCCQWLVSI